MNASDSFFSSGPPRASESRPRAVNPETGQEQSWQRASNYAAPLDNPHGLIKWQLRELVKGISARPDLARMLLTGAVIEDNAKADEIIAAAHAVAGTDAQANEGTAVHAALSRSFLGHEVPSEYMPHVRAFADELRRNGLEPVATEVTFLNTTLGSLGHGDWVVKTADGRFLVLDVKTGRLGDAKRKFAVQCVSYAGSGYIDDGKNGWVKIPFQLDRTEAVLAHVDPETGATALYRVDLVLGLYGATLAERVRDWHKVEVLSPYVPVHAAVQAAQGVTAVGVDPHGGSIMAATRQSNGTVHLEPVAIASRSQVSADQLGGRDAYNHLRPDVVNDVRLATLRQDARTPWEAQMASAEQQRRAELAEETRLQEIELHQSSPIASSVDTTSEPLGGSAAVAAGEALNASVEAEKAELMKLDKAALQMKAKNEHGATDLAHNREWLACYIIAKRRGCDESAAVMFAKSKGTMKLGGAASYSRPAPSNEQLRGEPGPQASPAAAVVSAAMERAEEFGRDFVLRSIAAAKSEGAIMTLRDNIVERRGDQAWTDEYAAAARTRVLELIAAENNGVSEAARIFARIGQATDPQHIADLWTEVTIGGSVPENWTQFWESADRRMAEIHAAQGAPPANPYGPRQ